MATLSLSPVRRERFEFLLKHRRLNDAMTTLLADAKKRHQLKKTELKASKTLSYASIVEQLTEAIRQKWISEADLARILDDSELAGRQHLQILTVVPKKAEELKKLLRSPEHLTQSAPSLLEFLDVPSSPSARILKDDGEGITVKLVLMREYWYTANTKESQDEKIILMKRQKERSAVILKYKPDHTLQCRVPPREKSQSDSAKTFAEFLGETFEIYYPGFSDGAAKSLQDAALSDAIPGVVKDEQSFVLWQDNPVGKNVQSRMAGRGRPNKDFELRKAKEWNYKDGYARKSIRGFWKLPSGEYTYFHISRDSDGKNSTPSTRIVFPDVISDAELEHVLKSIRSKI